jgi:coiled-coil and C2 domain-containing protein 1
MEALEQRLVKYKAEVDKASKSEDTSKARRLGRIVKQYEEAISAHRRGRVVAFEDLPTPPGFAPIPVPAPASAAPPVPLPVRTDFEPVKLPSGPQHQPQPVTHERERPLIDIDDDKSKPTTDPTPEQIQLLQILQRQKEFKEAALAAKHSGDIDRAREFLRIAKGFDKVVEDSQAGAPIDFTAVSYILLSMSMRKSLQLTVLEL